MNTLKSKDSVDDIPVLSDDVPVKMPELPQSVSITSLQQFKAISDRTRSRILGIIQNQPATAKQIADRLGASPGVHRAVRPHHKTRPRRPELAVQRHDLLLRILRRLGHHPDRRTGPGFRGDGEF